MPPAFLSPTLTLPLSFPPPPPTCHHRPLRMSTPSPPPPPTPPIQHIPSPLARALHARILSTTALDATVAACAASVAEAITQTYSVLTNTTIFICCGPGFNGLVGAHTALLLKPLGYSPTVFRLPNGLHASATDAALAAAAIPLCDFVPTTLDFYFDVAVDALLGVGFDGRDIRPHYWPVFAMLLATDLPIISVDVPSGWDLDAGPRAVDAKEMSFLRPEVLVSLGVPKDGSKMFAGAFHFVGGRGILPPGWADENNVSLPAFREGGHCALLASSGFARRNSVGEAYGTPGRFEATLWNPNPRRKWVSDDEVDDMDIYEWE